MTQHHFLIATVAHSLPLLTFQLYPSNEELEALALGCFHAGKERIVFPNDNYKGRESTLRDIYTGIPTGKH